MGSALPLLGLPSKADIYAAALEGLVQVNSLLLDKDPRIPPIYAAGVRWRGIPHNNWRRADQIAGEGWGDCEGLSSWRAAELRRTGEDPYARVGCYHTGPKKYHAIVIRGDDMIEDPSILLGMKIRPTMPTTRAELNVINGMWPRQRPTVAVVAGDEEWSSGVLTDFIENPDGSTAAQIKIPLNNGTTLVASTAPLKWQGILSRPGDFLERPENTAALAKMGPYGKIAAEIIKNPLARQARQATHELLRQIPGLGKLF